MQFNAECRCKLESKIVVHSRRIDHLILHEVITIELMSYESSTGLMRC